MNLYVEVFPIWKRQEEPFAALLPGWNWDLMLLTGNYASFAQTQTAKDKEAKTTFQTAEPWKPETDVRADATICLLYTSRCV